MAHKRVTYLNRLTMVLCDLAVAGLTIFTIPQLVTRLKDQNLPPLGARFRCRVNVLLLEEVKKGNIAILDRSRESFKLTDTGCTRYSARLGNTSTKKNVPSIQADVEGSLNSKTSLLNSEAMFSVVRGFVPLLTQLQAAGILQPSNDIVTILSTPTEDAIIAFTVILQDMPATVNNILRELNDLDGIISRINSLVALGFRPSALLRLQSLTSSRFPVVQQVANYARAALERHKQISALQTILDDWALERQVLVEEIEALRRIIATLPAEALTYGQSDSGTGGVSS